MNQQTAPRKQRQSTDEARLADYLRSVWPSDLSLGARLNLLDLYRAVAAEDTQNRPFPAAHPDIPDAWIERGGNGTLVGVGGLTRAPTPHTLVIRQRELYAWCAFDCMFLPGVLGAVLEDRSTCAATGAAVSLRVSAEMVESVSPASAVISFVTPDAASVEQRLRQVFCRHVRFFESAKAAGSILPREVKILAPTLAHRLGRVRNHTVFGEILDTGHSSRS